MTAPVGFGVARKIATWLVTLGAAVALMLGVAGPASALPPSGAGSNTPGTSSSVSPSTIQSGGTLHFTLRGFPAGEVVSIKIDDGNASSGDQSVQGQGVVHTQKIPSSGTVSGSFVLPSLSNGNHTLRFLASTVVPGKGTKGYTNKSPAFMVGGSAGGTSGGASAGGNSAGGSVAVPGSSSNSTSSNGSTTSQRVITVQRPGSTSTTTTTAQGAQVNAAQGAQQGTSVADAAKVAPASAPAATIQPAEDPAAESQKAEAKKEAEAQEAAKAAAASSSAQELADTRASLKAVKAQNADLEQGFPWIGAIAMFVVVLALVVLTWLVARRGSRGSHGA
ncbi:MAG: hypothetical protein ACTII7_12235 [Galactobacter sp.]